MELAPGAISHLDSDQLGPTFACLRCWKMKKRCDKDSPKCGRCNSVGAKCVFSTLPPTKSLLHSRSSWQATMLDPCRQDTVMHASAVILDAPLPSTLPDRAQYLPPASALLTHRREYHACFSMIYDMFSRFRKDVKAVCNIYLQTMNVWLPIIIDAQLQEQLNMLKEDTTPHADVCILMLCICLVTTRVESASEWNTDLEQLYVELKPLYLKYQSITPPTISVVQAGLLFATYEQGNGLEQEAYQSLVCCTHIGYLLELDKTLRHHDHPLGADQTEFDTKKHIWWCIVILERTFALPNLSSAKNFTCPNPSHNDYLPTFNTPKGNRDHELMPIGILTASKSEFPKHSIEFSRTSPFGRNAQVIYLLGCVSELLMKPSHDSDAWYSEAESLDAILQSFALATLHNSNLEIGKNWHHSCAPYATCISLLIILHRHCILGSSTNHNLSPQSRNFQQKSLLALKTLARSFAATPEPQRKDLFLDRSHTPPYGLFLYRDAALFSLEMEKEGENVEQWQNNFHFLRDCLNTSSRKWKIATNFLHDISRT